eukprot:2327079-Rhodomonas_salina.2
MLPALVVRAHDKHRVRTHTSKGCPRPPLWFWQHHTPPFSTGHRVDSTGHRVGSTEQRVGSTMQRVGRHAMSVPDSASAQSGLSEPGTA